MSAEVVIDLGLERPPPEDQAPPVDLRQVWSRWRRPLWSGLCVTVAFGALTASAPPPSPGLILLASRPEATDEHYTLIGDEYLIIHSFDDGVASVHQLPGGEYLWTGHQLTVGDVPGVLYSRECPDSGECEEAERERVAWDAATGARLGSVPGDPVPGAEGRLYLFSSGHYERMFQTGDVHSRWGFNAPDRLEVRDATGAPRWSTDRPDWLGYWVHADADTPTVVVYDQTSVTLRDAADGDVLGRWWMPEAEGQIFSAQVVGDLLLINGLVGDDTVAYGLHVDDLTPRWRRRWPGGGWVSPCSELLCHQQWVVPRAVTVVDPVTGVDLWSTAEPLEWVGDRFLMWPVDPLTGLEAPSPDLRVLAPRTGETLVELSGWTMVGVGADGTLVLTAEVSAGTAVALLDPDATVPHYLGTVAERFVHCQPFNGGMVCSTEYTITLWAIDAGG